MKYTVEIIKKHKGFDVGQKKKLTLANALHLQSKGIAKILETKNVDSLADIVENLESIVIEQGARIAELEKLIPKK